jgi:hypothetical protein
MITAVIAYYRMGPRAAHRVADILRHHPDYATWMSQKPTSIPEDEYLFMRASTWPDDIRSENHPSHDFSRPSWHYMDIWFPQGGVAAPPDERGEHIEEAVTANEALARNSTDPAERARALCWLFHLYGDVEMPLHTTSLVSAQFPRGDSGGNRVWITTGEGAQNLHSYWDGLWDRDVAFNHGEGKHIWNIREADEDLTQIDGVAKRVAREHPVRTVEREYPAKSFEQVVAESNKLAKEDVYLNGSLPMGTSKDDAPKVPADYEARSKALGEVRLALGGYRLAADLESIVGR